MQPGIDHFIDAAKNEAFYQADIDIFADAALLLPRFDDLGNEILVHFRHFPDLVFGQAVDLMGSHLVQNGHVPVPLKLGKMTSNKIAQLIQTAFRLVNFRPKPFKDLFGFVMKKIYQDVVFIFKIQVNCTISHTGFLGDLGNG